MRRIDSLFQIVTRRTDARPVAIVRMLVGLAAIGFALEAWVNIGRVLSPQVVDMPYVAWYPSLSVAMLPLFIGLWLCAALAFALGLGTRVCGAILTLSMAYTLFFDQQLYSNHLYLATLVVLLLTIAESGARFSLDARRSGGRDLILEWPILLLKIEISIVYFYAALLKVNPQYLSGVMLSSFWPFNQLAALPGGWSSVPMLPIASGCLDPDRAVPGDRAVGAAPALAGAGGWHRVSYADYLDWRSAARRPRYPIRDLRAGDGRAIRAVLRFPSATLSSAGIFGRGQTRTNADVDCSDPRFGHVFVRVQMIWNLCTVLHILELRRRAIAVNIAL